MWKRWLTSPPPLSIIQLKTKKNRKKMKKNKNLQISKKKRMRKRIKTLQNEIDLLRRRKNYLNAHKLMKNNSRRSSRKKDKTNNLMGHIYPLKKEINCSSRKLFKMAGGMDIFSLLLSPLASFPPILSKQGFSPHLQKITKNKKKRKNKTMKFLIQKRI